MSPPDALAPLRALPLLVGILRVESEERGRQILSEPKRGVVEHIGLRQRSISVRRDPCASG
jgi:hypothetical protein